MRAKYKRSIISGRDWLSKFSGEDYKLIHDAQTDKKVKSIFAIIGCLVIVITLFSFYSSYHFIKKLFNDNLLVSIPIGIFWCLMIGNIYVLLLYTISPKLLTGKHKSKSKIVPNPNDKKFLTNLSVGFRMGFVILIAIIIAQPFLVTTFSSSINEELAKYKQQYRNDFIIQADSLLISEEHTLFKDLQRESNLFTSGQKDSLQMALAGVELFSKINDDLIFLSKANLLKQEISNLQHKRSIPRKKAIDSLYLLIEALVEDEIRTDSLFVIQYKPIVTENKRIESFLNIYQGKLVSVIKEKNNQYRKLDNVISSSNFYVRQIQIINASSPLAWIMTSATVLLFIIPIFLKFRIRNISNFYDIKQSLEHRIVDDEYRIFKIQFAKILFNNYGVNADYYEYFLDPPYNTQKKNLDFSFNKQDDLLNKIYKDEQEGKSNKYVVSDNIV